MVLDVIARMVAAGDISAWPDGEFLLADATVQAAVNDPSNRRQAVIQARSGVSGKPIFESFMVTVGSTAGTIVYTHLQTGSNKTANLAEYQSIAWALTHKEEEAVLVTQDKHAAMLATAELGIGRVCHPYEFWGRLHSRGHLKEPKFTDLMNATQRGDQSIAIPWRMQPHP